MDEHNRQAVEVEKRVLLSVPSIEACADCDETFTVEEQHAFDPNDNDHCPRCGGRSCLTTYYGDPEYCITEDQLGAEWLGDTVESAIAAAVAAERARIAARLRARADDLEREVARVHEATSGDGKMRRKRMLFAIGLLREEADALDNDPPRST